MALHRRRHRENIKINHEANLPKSAEPLHQGHTLVKVAYASLNHLEYKVAEMPLASAVFSKPATPGLDFSGTVVATTLNSLKPGQRVFGRTEPRTCGTLAEYVVVGKSGVAALPAGVSLRDAACVGICGVAALQSLAPFVGPGSSVLINGGSSVVGEFAIQIAKALECENITTICSGKNAELCRSLGADNVIDHRSEDPVAVLNQAGRTYSHILDTVFSNSDLYWQCHHFLGQRGTYVSVGLPIKLQAFRTLFTIYILPRFLGGGRRKFRFHSVTANPEDLEQLGRWIAEGRLKAVIDEEYELEDADRAYGRLKSGRASGKLVVRVCGEDVLSS
ncbi:Zinc-type alcohol dehydrogenase-like protein C16A3.02c 1 [Colletotrichum chlorophyti]|uniref:Zinc-type alcohol dehydrogenase-like protein C16A3.02c 1 n=1 Tax=Colletotrichum chlorophyti TaxID=708187 RepID=A0A1Q8RUL7_9PEZI|nr:Zinc-type alcohol dehydrogenase-like protein C16A3.02c 1 [Colletotrichum chlorophyti]